jgi:hypothetical protein
MEWTGCPEYFSAIFIFSSVISVVKSDQGSRQYKLKGFTVPPGQFEFERLITFIAFCFPPVHREFIFEY